MELRINRVRINFARPVHFFYLKPATATITFAERTLVFQNPLEQKRQK